MPPTFSVLMPVYNHEGYVCEALDSVLAQTDPDWEAIVIDDGSTDGTGDVVNRYAARDPRIRVYHQANGGQGRALNAALRRATGTWICWLSSDDAFRPDKLATHRRYFEVDPDCRFFFTAFDILREETGEAEEGPEAFNAPPEARWRLVHLLSRNYINGITICVHRCVFEDIGEFEPRYRYAQDYDLYLRIMRAYPTRFLEERTCIKRCHAEQWAVCRRQAMFHQCAESAIRFLNTCPFDELFPDIDLADGMAARDAMEQALDIALSPHAYVNQLGVHTALLGRIVEWLTLPSAGDREQARRLAFWDLREAGAAAAGCFHSGVYLAASIAVAAGRPQAYVPVALDALARASMGRVAPDSEEAVELGRFLSYLGASAPVASAGAPPDGWRTLLAVGELVDEDTKRTLLHTASAGVAVVVLAPRFDGLGIEGNQIMLRGWAGFGQDAACAACGPLDVVVGERRVGWLLRVCARAAVVLARTEPDGLSRVLVRTAEECDPVLRRVVPRLTRAWRRLQGAM